jgi:hypothetical protein
MTGSGYVVRVELPGGESSEVYGRLHQEMGRAEFYPYFVSTQGETLALPHATYVHEGAPPYFSLEQAHASAQSAAQIVDPEARILSFEKGEALFTNLNRWHLPGTSRVGGPIHVPLGE